ncbi:adenosylcobinamide-GDP ribazoletransferase [Marinomonas sp. 2405UD68-3]|uniref:adenosylcobinamide-GDP ribazoletransferase n=1 Tax=Marinomonas sp. 2405UD68-3 TaxID=3391835 RepID=UPI0039C8E942
MNLWKDIHESAKRSLVTYTRIPLSVDWSMTAPRFPSVACLPWVGVMVGLISAWPLMIDVLGVELQVLLMMLTAVLVTGAFHEDGLMDAADGLVGGWTIEKRLEIMKDSRIGSYASVAIWFALALKFFLLLRIFNESNSLLWPFSIWLIVHSGARMLPLLVMRKLSYVSSGTSKASSMIHTLSVQQLIVAGVPCMVFSLITFGLVGVIAVALLIFILTLLMIVYLSKKLQGFNGDTLGASEQIAEVALLFLSLCLIVFFQSIEF